MTYINHLYLIKTEQQQQQRKQTEFKTKEQKSKI